MNENFQKEQHYNLKHEQNELFTNNERMKKKPKHRSLAFRGTVKLK